MHIHIHIHTHRQRTLHACTSYIWRHPCKYNVQKRRSLSSYNIFICSFGIVLWEICTRKLPFDHYSFNYEVVDAVLAGERPEIPKATVDGYSSLMMDCWQQQSNKRPPFTAILPSLENIYNSLFTFTEENSVCGTVELTGSLADSSSQ
jgi:hypothetical protein